MKLQTYAKENGNVVGRIRNEKKAVYLFNIH
jgi:hypothetical protein